MQAKALQQFGLSEREAEIYLVMLQLGPTTALQIARSTNLKRPTVYNVLEDLKKRGLVGIEMQGWKRKFVAAEPYQLESTIGNQQKKFEQLLPELLGIYRPQGTKTGIKYYEGLEGLKTIYETNLREIRQGDPWCVIAHQPNWYTLDSKWFDDFLKRRARRNIEVRIIFQDSESAREHSRLGPVLGEKVKIFNHHININSDLIVCARRFIVHTLAPPIFAVVTENKDIVNAQIELFNYIWDTLPDTTS